MTPYPNDGCPNCDPDHAPATEAAREWLKPNCWGKGHYHPYVEHDFHETADMLIKVEAQAQAHAKALAEALRVCIPAIEDSGVPQVGLREVLAAYDKDQRASPTTVGSAADDNPEGPRAMTEPTTPTGQLTVEHFDAALPINAGPNRILAIEQEAAKQEADHAKALAEALRHFLDGSESHYCDPPCDEHVALAAYDKDHER